MAEARRAWDSLDDITVDFFDYAQGDHQKCRQLARHVLERGSNWAVVMFVLERLQGRDRKWVRRVALHRYRYQGGGWRKHSAITMGEPALIEAATHLKAPA